MSTVAEFKEWLNKFPEDTIVEVAIQGRAGMWESYGPINFEELKLKDDNIGRGWEFIDFRNNPFVKENERYFNKCILSLGECYA